MGILLELPWRLGALELWADPTASPALSKLLARSMIFFDFERERLR